MKFEDLNNLYQKFCFIQHLKEENIDSQDSEKLLKKYGYTISTVDDLDYRMINARF